MTTRYHVHPNGPRTTISFRPEGEWARYEQALQAAIQHLEEHIADCQATMEVLRRAAGFQEYRLLAEEMVEGEAEG